jgi:hypothetical protein
MNITDIFTKGFTCTEDPIPYDILSPLIGVSSTVSYSELKMLKETKEVIALYDEVQQYLGDTYVSQLSDNYTKGYRSMWNHTESTTKTWHNDFKEGYNIFFMCYFNTPDSGGELKFRAEGVETGVIKPRPKLLVLGSQELVYEHKVMPHTGDRWAFNSGFSI